MSRIGNIFLEAAKHPESWRWETSMHIQHIPTNTTLCVPGLIKLCVYDTEVKLGVWESLVIRLRIAGFARRRKKQRRANEEKKVFERMSKTMLGFEDKNG